MQKMKFRPTFFVNMRFGFTQTRVCGILLLLLGSRRHEENKSGDHVEP